MSRPFIVSSQANIPESPEVAIRVLLVDDSEAMRRVTGAIVRSRHWTVCGEAENGTTGVQKFKDLKPDVVLLDLIMPDITGIEAAKLMSASDPTVPLILFTIWETKGIEEVAKDAGIRVIVSKAHPWDLISSIESEVSRRPNDQKLRSG